MMGKNIISLLLLMHLTIHCCKGQDTILFKIQLHPESTYTTIQQNTVVSEIAYGMDGDEPLKNNDPSFILEDSTIIRITTGKMTNAGSFTITRSDVHHSNNQHEPPIITNTKYFGSCMKDKPPVFDSIFRENASTEILNRMLASLHQTYQETPMPDTLLTIGDQYSWKVRKQIPYIYDSIDIYIITTHHLRKVQNNIAFFDVVLTYSNPGLPEIEISGGGKGYIEYDIENQFEKRYVMSMETKMESRPKYGGMLLQISNKSNFSLTTEMTR